MQKDYPTWIDEYSRSFHQALSRMVPTKWSSLNPMAVFEALQGTFLERIHDLLSECERRKISHGELWNLFVHPSSLRSAIWYLSEEYKSVKDKSDLTKEKARKVFTTLNGVLQGGMVEDAWALNSNQIHTDEEVEKILSDIHWASPLEKDVRDVGKLYTSLASLGFALYGDFFPQEAHEIFGPYDASQKFGENASLVIKYFPKIRPKEIWPEIENFPYEKVKIYHVFKNITFRCEVIGMHSIYDGPVIPNTLALAIEVNDAFVPIGQAGSLFKEIAGYAAEYSKLREKLSYDGVKNKFLEWECYQFVDLFKKAGMEWRPTKEMKEKLEKAQIPFGLAIDNCPSYEEYTQSKEYDIFWLKELYSSHKF